MKISMPDNLETPFAMLMKRMPEELQADKPTRDALLVYLKLGGISMARRYAEARANFFKYDPLEIDTGFRFPRLQEATPEEASDGEKTNAENGEKDETGKDETGKNDENNENDEKDETLEKDKDS